jgi:phage tail sheath protein
MGIFDSEIDLPGVITHVEADYSYGFDSTLFGSTDSVAIIGTAFNGPTGEPTKIYSPEHAAYIFGDAYDSVKRQETTLVAGVQDAWDRGCRTIYAIRIGGKEMYKDFNFKIESPYRLRLSSMFPSNVGKECYVLYDGTPGRQQITLYKPIDRATISEKKRGLTSGTSNVLKTTIKLALDNGLTKDDRLVDMLNIINGHSANNVVRFSIVDKDGNDVTNSPDVYDLSLGVMFSGAYFIGRSHTSNDVKVVTETTLQLVNNNTTNLPYSGFNKKYFRKLVRNTDVSLPYPIFDEKSETLRENLRPAGILMVNDWDFLETAGVSSRAFVPDKIDYEETNLSKFEIYRRLGSGFAITAHAEKRKGSSSASDKPRIRETPTEDKNRIATIEDGLYSVLQNANMKFRVLTCANAEDDINGKLPRAEEFRVAVAQEALVLGGDIRVKANVGRKDLKKPRKYKISFIDLEEGGVTPQTLDLNDLNMDTVHKVIAEVANDAEIKKLNPNDFENGTLIKADTKLYRVGDKSIVELTGAGLNQMRVIAEGKLYEYTSPAGFTPATTTKRYILGEAVDHVFVYEKDSSGDFKNVGDLATMLSEEEDKVIVAAEDLGAGHENEIVIYSNAFDTMTVEELVDILNKNEVFSQLFTAKLSEDGAIEKDEFVLEGAKSSKAFKATTPTPRPTEVVTTPDRALEYDLSLYIPYRTTDNFLRQLAQHCTYTELKTAPTHGIVGVQRLTNTGLASIAQKVNEMLPKEFDLYAKNAIGHNMLDSNNLPYPIGKNVSLVMGQYLVTMDRTNYQYLSNGAAGYAGMVSTLPLEQSSTGQTIQIPDLGYQLTNTQLGKLTKAGIVTFRNSYTKGIVVTDGITMAPADSRYRRLSASRIVNTTEELIRAAGEPFIGKENHQANRDAIQTAIKSNLDKIKGTLIKDYDFKMSTDPHSARFSFIEIAYQIIPIGEIREIRNSIKMVDSITT